LDKQAALEDEYRLKRKGYEEKEDELINQRDKAVSIIEKVQNRSHYYLKNDISDKDILMKGHRQAERMKENVFEFESTNESLEKLARNIEKLDEVYYRKLRELNEFQRKGEDSDVNNEF